MTDTINDNIKIKKDSLLVLLTSEQKEKIKQYSLKQNKSLSNFMLNAAVNYIENLEVNNIEKN